MPPRDPLANAEAAAGAAHQRARTRAPHNPAAVVKLDRAYGTLMHWAARQPDRIAALHEVALAMDNWTPAHAADAEALAHARLVPRSLPAGGVAGRLHQDATQY